LVSKESKVTKAIEVHVVNKVSLVLKVLKVYVVHRVRKVHKVNLDIRVLVEHRVQ
jgi:hypothetical protein